MSKGLEEIAQTILNEESYETFIANNTKDSYVKVELVIDAGHLVQKKIELVKGLTNITKAKDIDYRKIKKQQVEEQIDKFINEKVRKRTGDYIMKTSIKDEFKIWWKSEEIKCDRPNNDELYDALTKRFGAYRSKIPKGWQDVCIVDDDEGEEW